MQSGARAWLLGKNKLLAKTKQQTSVYSVCFFWAAAPTANGQGRLLAPVSGQATPAFLGSRGSRGSRGASASLWGDFKWLRSKCQAV